MKRNIVETLKEEKKNFGAEIIIENNKLKMIILKHFYMGITDTIYVYPHEVENFFDIIKFIKENCNV